MAFPTTQIEGVELSRLVIGSNWLMGYSHQSAAKDRWIRSYMTRERVVEVLKALRHGYSHSSDALTAASQVIAINFQTVAAANNYWRV